MNILHTVASMDAKAGGPTTCTFDLATGLNALGCRTDILTIASGNRATSSIQAPFIKTVPFDAKTPLQISRHCRHFLQQNQQYDLYHTNGLWLDINHATCAAARKFRKPCVLSSHGMLYPRALERSFWRKKLILSLGHRNDIASATCLHATCQKEMEFIRTFGYKGPIAVIPNPTPPVKWIDTIIENHSLKRIGFLGRLHPVKKADKLIKAWKQLGNKVADAELILMGEGTPEYEKYLKGLAAECKYGHITFHGFVNGKAKFQELANLKVLCLVSDFENFGMTVTEALSVGTPVIANTTTPWKDLNTHHCGWWINATVDNIAITIEKALHLSDKEIASMSIRGKRLVSDKYAADKVAEMMATLYKWLLGECSKPEFVYE